MAHLLSEADPWSGVERHEDERVRREVPMQPLVDEAVGVEFVRCEGSRRVRVCSLEMVDDDEK